MPGRSPPGCRPTPHWSFTSTLSLRSGGLRRARSFEPVDYTVTFRRMSLQSALRVEGLFELSPTTQGVNPRTRFCRCLKCLQSYPQKPARRGETDSRGASSSRRPERFVARIPATTGSLLKQASWFVPSAGCLFPDPGATRSGKRRAGVTESHDNPAGFPPRQRAKNVSWRRPHSFFRPPLPLRSWLDIPLRSCSFK
jgi:hypothetical protein